VRGFTLRVAQLAILKLKVFGRALEVLLAEAWYNKDTAFQGTLCRHAATDEGAQGFHHAFFLHKLQAGGLTPRMAMNIRTSKRLNPRREIESGEV
jgi:hypothetical protein